MATADTTHPVRRDSTKDEIYVASWIRAHKISSALIIITAFLILSVGTYYELQRRIDQAMSIHKDLLDLIYQAAIIYSPDGGHAHLLKEPLDDDNDTFRTTDQINNLHLTEMIRVKYGSEPVAHFGFLPGESREVARANMDEARRRLQIYKANEPFNAEECNYIEDTLLGLSYGVTERPTAVQYLLWQVGLKSPLFKQISVRH